MELADLCIRAHTATGSLAHALDGFAITRRLSPGDFAHLQGDDAETLSLVMNGQVIEESYATGSWEPTPLMIWGPGALIGDEGLSDVEPYRTSAIRALTETALLVVYRKDLESAALRNPSVTELTSTIRAVRSRCIQGALLANSSATVNRRLGLWLHHLHSCITTITPGEPLAVSQDLLAVLARTTRPTANATLRQFADQGLISLRRSRISVCSVDALEAYLQLD